MAKDETPPTKLDYEIAAARLQQERRDCDFSGQGKTAVQFFVPSDRRPSPGSKIGWAAANLVEEIIPGFGKQNGRVFDAEGCYGFVFTNDELSHVRQELSKKYSATEPEATKNPQSDHGKRKGRG